MRKFFRNIAWIGGLLLVGIAFVRWGGEQTAEATRSRAKIVVVVYGFIAFIVSWVATQARKNR